MESFITGKIFVPLLDKWDLGDLAKELEWLFIVVDFMFLFGLLLAAVGVVLAFAKYGFKLMKKNPDKEKQDDEILTQKRHLKNKIKGFISIIITLLSIPILGWIIGWIMEIVSNY